MTPWATREDARQFWDDADDVVDGTLDLLLSVATIQAAAYAPVLADGVTPPDNYRLAVIYQARELWAASQRDGDVIGGGEFAIRSRPLTGTVKALLRPSNSTLVVG